MAPSLLERLERDLDRAIEHAQPPPNVIVCKEQHYTCTNIRREPPCFDSEVPKSRVDLINILGGSGGWGVEEVERKFSEVNEKVKKGYINPWYFWGTSILCFIIAIYVFSTTQLEEEFVCLTDSVCEWKESDTRPECSEMSGNDSLKVGCCYAFCYGAPDDKWNDTTKVRGGYEECVADESNNANINKNLSLETECRCKRTFERIKTEGHEKWRLVTTCGELRLYGEYRVNPSTLHITFPIFITFIILSIGISNETDRYGFYTSWRNKQIHRIVQDHFSDWIDKGIQVEYYPTSRIVTRSTGRMLIVAHIRLTLPPAVSALQIDTPAV